MSAVEKFLQRGHNASFLDGLAVLKESGASMLKICVDDKHDRPLAVMIIIRGKDEAAQIVAAVDLIEAGWHDPKKAECNTVSVLDRAEKFISGFEDDDQQEGGVELLRDLRALLEKK